MADSKSKLERFEKLLDYYAVGLFLSYRLIDSGLLQRKVKVTNRADDINELARALIPAFASDLRQADKEKELIKDVNSYGQFEYFGSAVDIANAYFDELQARGSEWENADLQELFSEYKTHAEKQRDEDRDY